MNIKKLKKIIEVKIKQKKGVKKIYEKKFF